MKTCEGKTCTVEEACSRDQGEHVKGRERAKQESYFGILLLVLGMMRQMVMVVWALFSPAQESAHATHGWSRRGRSLLSRHHACVPRQVHV